MNTLERCIFSHSGYHFFLVLLLFGNKTFRFFCWERILGKCEKLVHIGNTKETDFKWKVITHYTFLIILVRLRKPPYTDHVGDEEEDDGDDDDDLYVELGFK